MDNAPIPYLSITLEACILLSTVIFCVLILLAQDLPRIVRNAAVGLFANLFFITLFYLLINVGWSHVAVPLLWLFVPSTLTFGWLFYLFTVSYFNRRKTIVDHIIKWVPLGVFFLFGIVELLYVLIGDTWSELTNYRVLFVVGVLKYLFPIFNIFVVICASMLLVAIEKRNRNRFASSLVIDLRWSKLSLIIYSTFILGMVLSEVVPSSVSEIVFNTSLLMLSLYMGYFGIRRISDYLKVVRHEGENNPPANLFKEKQDGVEAFSEVILEDTQEGEITPEFENQELFEKVHQLVVTEKLFLKLDISVSYLSKQLEVNSKYISQAINVHGKANFNGYINKMRIEYATDLLQDGAYSNFSIEGIANESGFRSKSTFNAAFKKYIGLTPSQYIKEQTTKKPR